MSLIEEGPPKRVRMAHLAIVGSFAVNGVSELHSRLLREQLFPDFALHNPDKFGNHTNGVTPRRWLQTCNRALAQLVTSAIGDGWQVDLGKLQDLSAFTEDAQFRQQWQQVKRQNKRRLADDLRQKLGFDLQEASLFDVQVKRIHEYNRQLLNVLHVVALYQ